ncbi:MAG: GAF domain-containing protein, partial [Anaerolineae bacterium]|nr:GAF domain-containing protein [Anaerolineae bacterium]
MNEAVRQPSGSGGNAWGIDHLSSVRFRLLLLVLLAVLPVLGLTLYTHLEQRARAAAGAQETALRLVRLAVDRQDDTIRGTRQLLFALAQLPEMRGPDPDSCSGFLARLLDQYPHYVLLGVIGVDGEVLCSAPLAQGRVNLADRAYFQRARQTRAFAVGDYQIDRVTGKSTIHFGQPVLDGQGQVRAVVFASLDLAGLGELGADARLPDGSTLTILDRNGTILARYPDSGTWVGQSVPEASIVEAILAAQAEGTAETYGVDGVLRLFAFAPLSGTPTGEDVYLTIGIPTSVAFQEPDRVLSRNLVGLGMVAALVLAAAWFGGDVFIVRRLRQLVAVAQKLSAGDLSVRTGWPPGILFPHRKDELGQLATALDEMAESLEKEMAEHRSSEQALQAACQTLEQRATERTRELSALYDVMAAASASLDLETVMAHSLQHVLAVMNCEMGAIHLLDQSGELLQLAASQGISPETIEIATAVSIKRGLAGWAIERGKPFVVPDITKAQRPIYILPVVGSQAYIGVPMRARGQVLGVLSIVGATGRQFGEREVALLSSIADQVGVAVENAQLYKQAEQLAVMRERQRLARELHDAVTQSLYSLVLVAEASRRLVGTGDLDRLAEALTRLGEIGQQTLKEMRLLVYELR